MKTPLPPFKFKPLVPIREKLQDIEDRLIYLNSQLGEVRDRYSSIQKEIHDLINVMHREEEERPREKPDSPFFPIVVNGKEFSWARGTPLKYSDILEMAGVPSFIKGGKITVEINNHTAEGKVPLQEGWQIVPKPGCRALVTITWPK